MKHEIGTVMVHLPGGNQYEIIDRQPTPGSEFKGCYLLRCIDFWCTEDMGDEIHCWRENQEMWIASPHVDLAMQVYK